MSSAEIFSSMLSVKVNTVLKKKTCRKLALHHPTKLNNGLHPVSKLIYLLIPTYHILPVYSDPLKGERNLKRYYALK